MTPYKPWTKAQRFAADLRLFTWAAVAVVMIVCLVAMGCDGTRVQIQRLQSGEPLRLYYDGREVTTEVDSGGDRVCVASRITPLNNQKLILWRTDDQCLGTDFAKHVIECRAEAKPLGRLCDWDYY